MSFDSNTRSLCNLFDSDNRNWCNSFDSNNRNSCNSSEEQPIVKETAEGTAAAASTEAERATVLVLVKYTRVTTCTNYNSDSFPVEW